MKKLNLFLLLTLASSAFAGMPDTITFTFAGTVATGRRVGFDKSPYRPVYSIDFYNDGEPTKGDLTLNWNWPADLGFTFYHHGNHKTCNGTASLRGNGYTGNMRCPSGSYGVTITE